MEVNIKERLDVFGHDHFGELSLSDNELNDESYIVKDIIKKFLMAGLAMSSEMGRVLSQTQHLGTDITHSRECSVKIWTIEHDIITTK